MPQSRLLALLLALLLPFAACNGDDDDDDSTVTDDDDDTTEELPDPGEFRAGVATVKMPAPLGIGTSGYGGMGQDPSFTPFADTYPGTTRIHGALTFKAVALSRGDHYEVVFVRSDTVGVFQHLREAVIDELEVRLGKDMDDSLVMGGNHSHSGPGRMVYSDGLLTLLADTFFPEFYDNMVDALADVVELALLDLAPAEVGFAMAEHHTAHEDRRCENDALDVIQENPALPILAVQRDGQVDALVMSYGYHGTILDIDDLTLCPDMGGVAEMKIAERFDHPVQVLLFNAWGGDMRPGDEEVDPAAVGADLPGGFQKMEGLGYVLADAIHPVVESIVYTDTPGLRANTRRIQLGREALQYEDGEFPYEYGGVYCGGAGDGNCEDDTPMEDIDQACVPFPEDEPAPDVTVVTVGQIDDMYFVTGTGEWVTNLADNLLADMSAVAGTDDLMFIGYAQDYTGYSVSEDDWWQGGYEAGGTLWGPRQGDHIVARSAEVFQSFMDGGALPYEEPAPVDPFAGYTYDAYPAEVGLNAGDLDQDVPATAGVTDVVSFTVLGGDPWNGPPIATLEQDTGGGFSSVLRTDGSEVTSDGYEFWVDLTTDPAYEDIIPSPIRTFYWTFSFPVGHRVPTALPALDGQLRFSVTVPTADGGAEAVTTGAFTVL
jgi:hypothetical protein